MEEEEILEVRDDGQLISKKPIGSNYRLRSELSQEFLSRQPGFLERWGLLVFAALLLILLSSTWFVRYPDVINAKVVLTAESAPKEIVIKQEGRLIKLFVSNNQFVKQGEAIGWIDATANHDDVTNLYAQIDSITNLSDYNKVNLALVLLQRKTYRLGELASSYQAMINKVHSYSSVKANNFSSHQRALLTADIKSLGMLKANILSQKKLLAKPVSIDEQKKMLQLDASFYAYEMQQREKLNELNLIESTTNQQKPAIIQELKLFKVKIEDWISRHVIQAPINGKLSFTTILDENKYLRAGTIIGYINQDNNKYYAETILSQDNLGKVDTGMQVQLRFDAYPYQEWGTVNGKVGFISNVPAGNGFPASILLNNGLVTNDGKTLTYRYGLKAQAVIITKDMRLFDRLYFSLTKLSSTDK